MVPHSDANSQHLYNKSLSSYFSIATLTLTTQWPELALHCWQLVGKTNVHGTYNSLNANSKKYKKYLWVALFICRTHSKFQFFGWAHLNPCGRGLIAESDSSVHYTTIKQIIIFSCWTVVMLTFKKLNLRDLLPCRKVFIWTERQRWNTVLLEYVVSETSAPADNNSRTVSILSDSTASCSGLNAKQLFFSTVWTVQGWNYEHFIINTSYKNWRKLLVKMQEQLYRNRIFLNSYKISMKLVKAMKVI